MTPQEIQRSISVRDLVLDLFGHLGVRLAAGEREGKQTGTRGRVRARGVGARGPGRAIQSASACETRGPRPEKRPDRSDSGAKRKRERELHARVALGLKDRVPAKVGRPARWDDAPRSAAHKRLWQREAGGRGRGRTGGGAGSLAVKAGDQSSLLEMYLSDWQRHDEIGATGPGLTRGAMPGAGVYAKMHWAYAVLSSNPASILFSPSCPTFCGTPQGPG